MQNKPILSKFNSERLKSEKREFTNMKFFATKKISDTNGSNDFLVFRRNEGIFGTKIFYGDIFAEWHLTPQMPKKNEKLLFALEVRTPVWTHQKWNLRGDFTVIQMCSIAVPFLSKMCHDPHNGKFVIEIFDQMLRSILESIMQNKPIPGLHFSQNSILNT